MSIAFNDSEFSTILKEQLLQTDSKILLYLNKFHAKIYVSKSEDENHWIQLGSGELGEEVVTALKQWITKKRLLILESTSKNLSNQPPFEEAIKVITIKTIKAWLKTSEDLTKGRKGEVNPATKFKVACAAAWRCQFYGCGIDLREHLSPSMSGNYSYFAHIVASSEDGPRGNKDSEKLANEPTNIMLLCDKCHRLIDKIAPNEYGIEHLRKMRAENVQEINRLLSFLKFPEYQMVVIGGAIEGQPFVFNSQDADEAMWLRKTRNSTNPEYFLNNTAYFSASNNPIYWASAFQLLNSDIPMLKRILQGVAQDRQRKPLALFPLHGMSILILSGRLIGDSYPIILFQYHRQQIECKGKQWAWPEVAGPQDNKFKVITHKEKVGGDSEALLLVNITAKIPESELPEYLFNNGYTLPTIEITLDECSYNAISHPKDLEHLGKVIDIAYKKIQDEWRLQKVHLIMIAPTTACVRLGQKMQARHHADFILYERKPGTGNKGPFEPTIQICPEKVSLVATDQEINIS